MRPRLTSTLPFLKSALGWAIPRLLDFSDYKRTRTRIKNLELQVWELQHRLRFEQEIDKYYVELLKLLEPQVKIDQSDFIRIGSYNDGGYFLPKESSSGARWVTFGLGTNLDFELQLLANDCKVDSFDHTLAQRPKIHNHNFTYHPLGLGATSTKEFINLMDVCINLNLQKAKWHLKLDVEGAEWGIFDQLAALENPPEIIVCEVHGLRWSIDKEQNESRLRCLRIISEKYQLLSVNGNNYSANFISSFTELHDVIEVTLKLKSAISRNPEAANFSIPNHPNDPNGPSTKTSLW